VIDSTSFFVWGLLTVGSGFFFAFFSLFSSKSESESESSIDFLFLGITTRFPWSKYAIFFFFILIHLKFFVFFLPSLREFFFAFDFFSAISFS